MLFSKSKALILALICGSHLSTAANSAPASGSSEQFFIVKWHTLLKHSELSRTLHQAIPQAEAIDAIEMAGGAYRVAVKMKPAFRAQTLAQLHKMSGLAYVQVDRVGHFKPMPAIEGQESFGVSHAMQWDEFKAPQGMLLEDAAYSMKGGAWEFTQGRASTPIVVAVLDTGIADTHPALQKTLLRGEDGKVWGWNFAANNRNLADETGSYHGTHVSGTIAAQGDIIGMGPELKVLTLKIPDGSGMFYESQVINALYWSVGAVVPGLPKNPYPAKVLNMSFGVDEGPGKEIDHCGNALQDAVTFVREHGAFLVAAAGNDNHLEHFNAPAVCEGVLKIASTGPEGLRAYYSNYGPSVNFSAPGGDLSYGRQGGILSTVQPGGGYQGSGYQFYQGTSMASPHVAGLVGLVFAASDMRLTVPMVEALLQATTHDFGQSTNPNNSCRGSKPCGHGIADAYEAVKAAIKGFDVFFTSETVAAHPEAWEKQDSQISKEPGFSVHDNQVVATTSRGSYTLKPGFFAGCERVGFDGLACYSLLS